jgi:hypothetical protein
VTPDRASGCVCASLPRDRRASQHPASDYTLNCEEPSANISQACPTTDQLVVVNRRGGKVLSRPLQVDQNFAGLDFDPSGRHLLYTTGAPTTPFSARSTWDGTRAVEIGRGYAMPVW